MKSIGPSAKRPTSTTTLKSSSRPAAQRASSQASSGKGESDSSAESELPSSGTGQSSYATSTPATSEGSKTAAAGAASGLNGLKVPKDNGDVSASNLAGHSGNKAGATPPAFRATQDKLSPSGLDLLALDLAVSKNALSVPAVVLPRFTEVRNFNDLLRRAELVGNNQLVDQFGSVYKLGEKFSEGSFGSVRYAQKHDRVVDQQYVAKEIKRRPGEEGRLDERMLRAEVKTMIFAKSALAPHAILKTPQSMFILMPVLDGDCFDLVASLEHLVDEEVVMPRPADEVRRRQEAKVENADGPITVMETRERIVYGTMRASLSALTNLHQAGYAHRDVKPENLMYDRSGEMHLGDYGLATRANSKSQMMGTLEYLPLEAMVSNNGYQYRFTPVKGDMWGVGATAMMMLTNRNLNTVVMDEPYFNMQKQSSQNALFAMTQDYTKLWNRLYTASPDRYDEIMLQMSKQGNIAAPHLLTLADKSPDLFMPILSMMAPDPEMRPTAAAALQFLNENFTPDLGDLAKLIKAIDVPGRKAMQAEPQTAFRELVAADQLIRRRATRSALRSTLHVSFYEMESRTTFSALLPKNIANPKKPIKS